MREKKEHQGHLLKVVLAASKYFVNNDKCFVQKVETT